MKLFEALDLIESLDGQDVIFAVEPWTFQSEATIGRLDNEYRVPKKITDLGYSYFMDVFVALEVLQGFDHSTLDVQQRREVLLHYAKFDAFPEWANELNRDL